MAHCLVPAPDGKERGLIQQRTEINGGVDAGQFDAQPIGLGQELNVQREFNDIKFHATGEKWKVKTQSPDPAEARQYSFWRCARWIKHLAHRWKWRRL